MFPHINFIINGGFNNIERVKNILHEEHPLRKFNGLEGCMSGRMALHTPWECARVDKEIFGDREAETLTREEILLDYADYV